MMLGRGRLVQWKNVRFVNISSKGDRGSIPAEGSFFSDAIFSLSKNALHKGLTEILYRTGSYNHATLPCKSAVAAIYYCMKRNIALEIGPMTSLLS